MCPSLVGRRTRELDCGPPTNVNPRGLPRTEIGTREPKAEGAACRGWEWRQELRPVNLATSQLPCFPCFPELLDWHLPHPVLESSRCN